MRLRLILAALLLAALTFGGGRNSCGQSIQVSVAMPVTNQAVTITVPGLAEGGLINITDSHAETTQLVVNASGQAVWTPSRYGKYSISSGAAVQTMWVTARPMTFHWWSCTTAQTNVTVVMQRDAAWQARGVTCVDWTGGEAYSRGVDGHYWTNAVDWFNGWSYAYSTGGMAIDEAYCDAGFPTDPILQAIAMVRQAQGSNYSLNLWSAGFGGNFAAGAALLKSNNVTVLIEDYYGTWDLHASRWAAVRSYGLENQSISGIWPGTSPLTNEAAVRGDMALVRLAAPEANGIAIFAPLTNSFTPPVLSSVLNACDQGIEDYFLKPLIYLSASSSTQLLVWNLGNDDAAGFSLELLNGSGAVVQTVDLSTLTADGKWTLPIPTGAVNARVVNPPGTANLYTGNSKYSTGLYPFIEPGRYTWNNANGDHLWNTSGNWYPSGPPPGNIDSGNSAYFDGAVVAPHTVNAASGETSIGSVQLVTGGWTIAGSPTSQDFYTYSLSSSGAGTNIINIGISARDVVPAFLTVGASNTLVMNGLVGAVRNNGGLIKNGAGTLILTYANTFTGGATINAGTLVAEPAALPGNVSNAGTLQLGRSTGAVLLSSLRVSGAGLTILTDDDNGYINLSAANQLSAGGDLLATNVHVNQLGYSQAVGGFGGNGFWYNNGAPCTLTLGNNGNSATYSGSISDATASSAISVVKTGAGTQTLSGANNYHGSTTVSNGTLFVNGSLGTNTVTVAANATLGGVGTIGGVVDVRAGGTLSPGANGLGTLSLSKSPLLGGITRMELGKGASPNADQLLVSGQPLAYGGTLTVASTGTNALAAGDTFTLFSAAGYSGAFAATNLPPLAPGLGWAWTPTNGTLSVVSAVNPTPPNLGFSFSNGTLNLSWPPDHLGWVLQYQANSLATGLGTSWTTIPASQGMTSTNLPVDPAQPAVFYRLMLQ
jgi:autotransporter-associated beta strand protein